MKRNTTSRDRHRQAIAATRAACHICGGVIDYTLRSPHPMSFEIDHVIPLTRGGTDDRHNLAAAHRKCNSTKRARLVAPIVRRSGALG